MDPGHFYCWVAGSFNIMEMISRDAILAYLPTVSLSRLTGLSNSNKYIDFHKHTDEIAKKAINLLNVCRRNLRP